MPKDDVLEKLDEIALHLRRIDRRDKMRMIGSSIRGVVSLGVLAVILWSSVYFVQHLGDIVKVMTAEMAKQTVGYGKEGSQDFMQQLQEYFKE